MKNSGHFDAVIIGAGIAGLSTADALLQRGLRVAIFDRSEPGAGASGAPRVLINPATGRRAKMSWNAPEALAMAEDLIKRTARHSDKIFYEKSGVIRPALNEKLAKDFSNSPEKYEWPEGWIEWLDESEFEKKFPLFQVHHGGLHIKQGFTLKGDLYIRRLSEYLKPEGLQIFSGYPVTYKYDKGLWITENTNRDVSESENLICTTGHSLSENPDWKFLDLHNIKGQTATFQFDEPLPLNASVSSLGYMAWFGSEPNRLVVGSTYEHHPEYDEPDEEGLNYLRKKLDTTFPGWNDKATVAGQWSGYRTTVPDKKPLIGMHPTKENLFIFGALGSKGMSMGPYLGQLLADLIVDGIEVPSEVSIQRFL
ncbi:MAG: FAD-binding oxidoreductase [Balneolaceae bacterium]|nr:FAD-binding oxidoreductase [Balneolaceae bacterium]MCH8547312.1 FAD-binding oxidoreductase [Balneolaceae bacterium]